MWGTVSTACAVTGAVIWSVTLTVTDLRERRLPDALTLPAAALAWLWCLTGGHAPAVLGGFAWWALCVLPGRWSHRLRTGGGDAKLALSLGAVTAACGGVVGWWTAVVASGVLTLALTAVPGMRRQRRLPHGPGMLTGSWLSVVLGVLLTI